MQIVKKHRLFGIVIMFLFMFDISFVNIPTILSTRKIAFLILILKTIFSKIIINKKDFEMIKKLFLANVLIFLYVLCITFIESVWFHEHSIIPRYSYFLLYTICGSILLILQYDSEYDFFEDVIGSMWIQSIIIFFEFFSLSFKEILQKYFNSAGNVEFSRIERGTGLGAEAAALTMLLFLGVFCCNYIMVTKKVSIKYIFPQIVFMSAMFLVGRTGLYISLILIIFTVLYLSVKKHKFNQALKIIILITFGVLIGLLIMKNSMTVQQYNRFFNKIMSAIRNFLNDTSVIELSNMSVPALSINTMIGTGVYRGYSSTGLFIWNDSGYIQMYSALGLIYTVIFYTTLFCFYKKIIDNIRHFSRKTNVLFFSIYVIIIFIVECKEPFIFKYIIPLFGIVSVCLCNKRIEVEYKCVTTI